LCNSIAVREHAWFVFSPTAALPAVVRREWDAAFLQYAAVQRSAIWNKRTSGKKILANIRFKETGRR
jgi:hypothetical protein